MKMKKDEPVGDWYLYTTEGYTGPVSQAWIRKALAGGDITPEHYAWRDGMPEWKLIAKLPEFFVIPPAPPASADAPPPARKHPSAAEREAARHRLATRAATVTAVAAFAAAGAFIAKDFKKGAERARGSRISLSLPKIRLPFTGRKSGREKAVAMLRKLVRDRMSKLLSKR